MRIACIGGAHIDRHGMLKDAPVPATSNPGSVTSGFGGVARNVAENLVRLGRDVMLVSRVGDDESGRAVVAHSRGLGIDVSQVTVACRPTASYTAILDPNGELVLGLADMDLYGEITPAVLEASLPRLRECELWFVDANLPAETIEWLAGFGADLMADAISVVKSRRLRGVLDRLGVVFLNLAQAGSIADERFEDPCAAARTIAVMGARAGIVTAGASGIAVWSGDKVQAMAALPAIPRDVTGAGDALVAGTLFGISGRSGLLEAAPFGLAAAAIAVESGLTVAQQLTAELLYPRLAANRS